MSDNDTKRIIESTFNEVSKKYDANLFFNITAKHMANSFKSNNNFSLLDISTGTGIVAFEILKKHPTIGIEAVDISQGMLDMAQSKAKALNIKNISFRQYDVEKLHYDNNSFDIITCGFGLFFYPSMQETYNNLCQMIKKNGKFIFSSFTKDAFKPYSDIFFDSLENDYNIFHPGRNAEFLNTPEQIKNLVTNKSNHKYQTDEVKIEYKITINQWWELLNSAGFKALLNRLDENQLQVFKTQHLKDIKNINKSEKINLKVNTLVTTVFCN